MQKKQNGNKKEILSIEEYIRKMRKTKAEEKAATDDKEETSPAWMIAELYG